MAFAEVLPDTLGTKLGYNENGAFVALGEYNAASGTTVFDWALIEKLSSDPDPEKSGPANLLLGARNYGKKEG